MHPALEKIDWSSFLGRPRLASPAPAVFDALFRQPTLVTGAGGSIGAALTLRLAGLGLPRLVLLESNESNLYAIKRLWRSERADGPMIPLLGSVEDHTLLEHLFTRYQPRLVFHAAAFKHVPLMEEHPLAAIRNNVFGTEALVAVAARHGARVVLLSTDKAVEPASVMGATKRVAEQIVLAHGGTVLRLGNVLASRDSVAEIFADQIALGGPITITDPSARRYFLTLDEAVNMLLVAAAEAGPALFAPVLEQTHYVTDLAHFLHDRLAPEEKIAIDFTGMRPGDKDTEKLWAAGDTIEPLHHDAQAPDRHDLVRVESQSLPAMQLGSGLANLRAALETYDMAAALAHLRWLVPDYRPSADVEERARLLHLPVQL